MTNPFGRDKGAPLGPVHELILPVCAVITVVALALFVAHLFGWAVK